MIAQLNFEKEKFLNIIDNEFSHKFIFTSKMFFFSYGDIFRFSRVSRKGEAK